MVFSVIITTAYETTGCHNPMPWEHVSQ